MLSSKQETSLFWIIVALFTLITLLTIWGVFIGFKNLHPSHKDKLFYTFIVEIGIIIFAIIRNSFVKQDKEQSKRLWLDFGQPADVKSLRNRKATCSPRSGSEEATIEDITCPIIEDEGIKGYYIVPKLPKGTDSIVVSVKIGDDYFEGSHSLITGQVNLEKEE